MMAPESTAHRIKPSHLRRRFFLVCSLAALCLLLRRFDVTLMRGRYAIMPSKSNDLLEQLLAGFRNMGQVLSVLIAVCIVAAYDRRRRNIVLALLLAQGFAAVVYNAGKYTLARHRPNHIVAQLDSLDTLKPSQTWIGWKPGNTDFQTQSFPSGHSAAAFALAGVLAPFYRRLGWMFWLLAAGCALSRFLEAAHWPSDCLAGALIGLAAAQLGLKLTSLGSLPSTPP